MEEGGHTHTHTVGPPVIMYMIKAVGFETCKEEIADDLQQPTTPAVPDPFYFFCTAVMKDDVFTERPLPGFLGVNMLELTHPTHREK